MKDRLMMTPMSWRENRTYLHIAQTRDIPDSAGWTTVRAGLAIPLGSRVAAQILISVPGFLLAIRLRICIRRGVPHHVRSKKPPARLASLLASCNSRRAARRGAASEWVPGRAFGEFQIADIEAKTRANSGSDRDHENIVVDEGRHAKAADEIRSEEHTSELQSLTNIV